MKFFAVLAGSVVLASATPVKREQICNIAEIPSFSVVAEISSTVRWNVFQFPSNGILHNTLAWYEENTVDRPSKFGAIGTSNGANHFIFFNHQDEVKIGASGSGFAANTGSAQEFILHCPEDCNIGAAAHQEIAKACTVEVANANGKGTGQCVNWNRGSETPVTTTKCNSGDVLQQVKFFVDPL